MNISELKNYAKENNLGTVDFTFKTKDLRTWHGSFSIINDEIVIHGQSGKRTEAQFAIEGHDVTVKEAPEAKTPVEETPVFTEAETPVEEATETPVMPDSTGEFTETPMF